MVSGKLVKVGDYGGYGNEVVVYPKRMLTRYKTVKRGRRGRRNYNYRASRAKFNGNTIRPTVMPLKWKFTTRYVEILGSLTVTPGVTAMYVYSANGLYDPNISGTGHQPVGFDQMMLFYDHYTVVASKVKVAIQNESDQHPIIVALEVSDNQVAGTNTIQTIIENGMSKWKRLERQGSDGNFINNVKSSCVLTKGVSIKKFMGRPNILSEDDLRGTVAANPTEGTYWKIYAQSADGSADAITISWSIQIDYVAILTEPKLIAGS